MTASSPPPATTRAGLLLPGLGHLFVGRWIEGVGLMALVLLLAIAAVLGGPRLPELLDPTAPGGPPLHAALATLGWLGLLAFAWTRAWRLVRPAPRDLEAAGSAWGTFRTAFARHTTGMAGLVGVGLLLAVTLLAPLLALHDPTAVDVGPSFAPPSWAFPLGTDGFGRDLLARVLIGARVSVSIGLLSVAIAASVGTLVGAVAGYVGGAVDAALMWVVDLLLSLPRLVLLLAIVGLFDPQGATAIAVIVTVLGLTGWMGVARIVRSEVLSLKERDFVQAARALGLRDTRIVLHHVIPNAIAPVIVYGSLAVGSTMLAEAALSFLGMGVEEPTPTWGTIVNKGRDHLTTAWWIAILPGLAIVYAVTAFNLLGDGLRDALDPRQRGG